MIDNVESSLVKKLNITPETDTPFITPEGAIDDMYLRTAIKRYVLHYESDYQKMPINDKGYEYSSALPVLLEALNIRNYHDQIINNTLLHKYPQLSPVEIKFLGQAIMKSFQSLKSRPVQ